MATVTLTSKRQTTIPKEICSYLHVRPGDRLEFVIEEDGRVILLPKTGELADLAKILPPPRRHLTIKQINRIIAQQGAKHGAGR